MMKEFNNRRQDMNTKKLQLAVLQFLNLTGKIPKFHKIWDFDRNIALNYFSATNFHMIRLGFKK